MPHSTKYDAPTRSEVSDQRSDRAVWNYAAAASGIVNTTTAVTIKAAASRTDPFSVTKGLRNYITGISFCSDALGAATELAIRDGAGGTVLWRTKLGTAATPQTSIVFPSPLRGSENTLLEVVTLTASVTGGVFFNATGYVGE
jgi:hypothetical protein